MSLSHIAETLVTPSAGSRRAELAIHELRIKAKHLLLECEALLDSMQVPARDQWRPHAEAAYLVARQISSRAADLKPSAQPVERAIESVRPLGQRIVSAMNQLLHLVPITIADELLLSDAARIRHLAETLTTPFDAETPRPKPPPHTNRSGGNGAHAQARVLIVDDEKLLRSVLNRLLTGLGYHVTEAEDGQHASEILKSSAFDTIITDINMPRLNGIELLRWIKAFPRTRDIPVIVVSSQDDLRSAAQCIELGAEDHIPKPYEAVILKARLRASLERKRMRDHELHHLERVAAMTAAAEAVERETYVPGSIAALMAEDDDIGQLARVFDRMVRGLRTREERLQYRLHQLRTEMGDTTGRAAAAADVSAESPFGSGEILATRYEILGRLGQGGMGMVYHARDLELGEEIALKVVRRDLVRRDPTLVDRLKSEIRLARRISHRNVVRAHDLGEWQGTYFITMELVRGITLAELLDRRGRLSVESTLAIGTQLADALSVAHDLQIVHRDIKPANLLVDEAGTLKVMDFGLARYVERDVHLTANDFIVGTPQYMAPEQLMGGHVDARSDLFAVGVVLYECLAGRAPFTAETPMSLLTQIVEGRCVPLDAVVAGIPAPLSALTHQLLRAEPSDRLSASRELAQRLTEIEHQ